MMLKSILILFFPIGIWAAPIPMTSTSAFFQTETEIFRSALGYVMHAADTKWVQVKRPKNNPYIEVIYRPDNDINVQAALSVRVDKPNGAKSLEDYVNKWIKDYPRFGLEIIDSKKVRVGKEIGYLIDLMNKDNSRQLRQVIFFRPKHVVSMTCRDDSAKFQKTLKSCNDIIRTFQWTTK